MVTTVRINTWAEARALADVLSPDLWAFRGQESSEWDLSTTLQRAGQQEGGTNPLLSSIEDQIVEAFQRRAHHYLPGPPPLENLIEWLALIQHYGGPTRLLDFTHSFYVAAFFAIEKATAESAVWCVDTYELYRAATSKLGLDTNRTFVPYWQVSYRTGLVAQEIIKNKRHSAYERFVFEAQPFRLNERLAVQQGVFLCPLSVDVPLMESLAGTLKFQLSDFATAKVQTLDSLTRGVSLGEALKGCSVIKVLLPVTTHHDALHDLWKMNISAATLFPGLDGFARSLRHFIRIDNLWHVKFMAEYRTQQGQSKSDHET
jgi:FRG domain